MVVAAMMAMLEDGDLEPVMEVVAQVVKARVVVDMATTTGTARDENESDTNGYN
jgi:hypothetical protein